MTIEQMIAERDTRSAALSAALATALAAANSVKGGTASASISDLADDLDTKLAAANDAVSTKGGTVIAQNLSRLPLAIASIPQGGSSVTVEPLSVTVNGTYTADQGKAYSPVTVNVSSSSLPTGFSMLTPDPLPADTRKITIDFDDISHVLAVAVMCGRDYVDASGNTIVSAAARAATSRTWFGTNIYASSSAGTTTNANQVPTVDGNSITLGHASYGNFIGGAQYYIFVYKEAA